MNFQQIDLQKLSLVKYGRAIKLVISEEDGNLIPFQLHTSKMYIPFGANSFTNKFNNSENYHIDCSLNQSKHPISVKFNEFVNNLDSRILELVNENLNLFNSQYTFEETDYTPLLKPNGTYPELMKISLPRDKYDNFDFVVFNENVEKIPLDESNVKEVFCKGKLFKGIIECSKIWVYNGRCGSSWQLVQLKFEKPQERKEIVPNKIDKCIIDDD